MPNLPAHIQLATSAAAEVRRAEIDAHLGYYYLGATSPDIRALTKRARSEYHFVELDFESIGTGVETMFAAYPELMNAAEHDGPTRAFVAGYITHLLADESYIVRMYRPHFGDPAAFEDRGQALIWDRALQLDLDRQVWREAQRSVSATEFDPRLVSVRFLPTEDLLRWKEWVLRVVNGGFSWERLRFMARRIAAGNEEHPAYEHAEAFVASIDKSLGSLYTAVPKRRVAEFKAEAVDTIAEGLRGYLS